MPNLSPAPCLFPSLLAQRVGPCLLRDRRSIAFRFRIAQSAPAADASYFFIPAKRLCECPGFGFDLVLVFAKCICTRSRLIFKRREKKPAKVCRGLFTVGQKTTA
jgi:hypothetical protein